jgi:hypothetical protein
MIAGPDTGRGHLDDAALLRAIDGQLGTDERAEVEAHLASCADCARERDALAQIAARVSMTLDATIGVPAVPVRGVRALRPRRVAPARPPRWLMAASLVLFALLATLAFPQGRAFALGLLRRWRPAPEASTETKNVTADPPVRALDRVLVEVTPTESRMVIELAAENSGGTIRIEPHQSNRLVLRSASAPAVLVFPSALRVNNESTPQADFRVLAPPMVQEVVIRVRGRQVCRAGTTTVSECRIEGSR